MSEQKCFSATAKSFRSLQMYSHNFMFFHIFPNDDDYVVARRLQVEAAKTVEQS